MTTHQPREPGGDEWAALVAWLDDGLRRGDRGRLQGEYPISLRPENTARHRVITEEGRFLAHAMSHRVQARVDGAVLPLGLISLVFTDPAARGRGLASRCVEACVEAATREGLALALLWTDRASLYRRLGFHEVGRERLFAVEARHLRRARAGDAGDLDVRTFEKADLPALEALYAARTIRADRERGSLGALLGGPGVEALVAHGDEGPRGYAALGRGDDFRGIVHEWAGDADAVLACLADVVRERPCVGLLGGPRDEGPLPALLRASCVARESPFAMARLLDPGALLRASTAHLGGLEALAVRRSGPGRVMGCARGRSLEVPDAEFLRLILGGPDAPDASALGALVTAEERALLDASWPWPLYLWGFDSI